MDGAGLRQGSISAPGSQEGKCGHGDRVTMSHFPLCVDEVIGNTDAQPRLHPMEQLEILLEQMREERNEEPGPRESGASGSD